MSWESSALVRLLQRISPSLRGLGGRVVLLLSVDFAPIERLQVAGDWAAAGELLAADARALQAAGADLVVLCTNTMHRVAERAHRRPRRPAAAHRRRHRRRRPRRRAHPVGLLGTASLWSSRSCRDRLAAAGLRWSSPTDDRDEVHRVIYEELCWASSARSPGSRLPRGGRPAGDAGAQGVVLGCTEIELLIGPDDVDGPGLPDDALHVEAAVRGPPAATLTAVPAGCPAYDRPVSVTPIRLVRRPGAAHPGGPGRRLRHGAAQLVADLTDTMHDAPAAPASPRRRSASACGCSPGTSTARSATWSTPTSTRSGRRPRRTPRAACPSPASASTAAGTCTSSRPAGTCTASRSASRAREMLARAIQHETDHLDGVLFIDRLDAEARARGAGRAGATPSGPASRPTCPRSPRPPVVKVSPH